MRFSSSGKLGKVEEEEGEEAKSVSDEENGTGRVHELAEADRLKLVKTKVPNYDTEWAKGEI